MKHTNVQKLTMTALFIALTCVATSIIKIPTVGTGGYIHPGDAFVILSGILLGPLYGALAAGIGSALADLFGGYFIYVPITFLVKACIGAGVGFLYHHTGAKLSSVIKCILCGIYATIVVALGYLFFEWFIYGAAALASVPANLVQGISGLILSTLLLPFIQKLTR